MDHRNTTRREMESTAKKATDDGRMNASPAGLMHGGLRVELERQIHDYPYPMSISYVFISEMHPITGERLDR
jgi:hypothetical protein